MPENTKPTVTIPEVEAPSNLVLEDEVVGAGIEAASGATVEVHYVGVSWSDANQFDASWDRDETFTFPLGAGYVISGWDQGVVGMREGGRRRITIPPALGYGSSGIVGVIKPNETLVFIVDLISVS